MQIFITKKTLECTSAEYPGLPTSLMEFEGKRFSVNNVRLCDPNGGMWCFTLVRYSRNGTVEATATPIAARAVGIGGS